MSLHTCMYFCFKRRYFKECAGNYFPCIYKTQKKVFRLQTYTKTPWKHYNYHKSIYTICALRALFYCPPRQHFVKKKKKKKHILNLSKCGTLWYFCILLEAWKFQFSFFQTAWSTGTTFFKMLQFLRRKVIWVWDNLRVSKCCQKFHFWFIIPLTAQKSNKTEWLRI